MTSEDAVYSLQLLDQMIEGGTAPCEFYSAYDNMEEIKPVPPSKNSAPTSSFAPLQFRRRDHKKERLVEWWKQKRNNEQLSDQINRHHNCFEENCQMNGRIYNPHGNYFICLDSGLVHECNTGREKCPYVITTNYGNHVCSVSARDIGVVLKGEDNIESYSEYGKVGEEGSQAKASSTRWNRAIGAIKEKQERTEFLLSPTNRKKPFGSPAVKVTSQREEFINKVRKKNFEKDPLGFYRPDSVYYIKESASSEIKNEISACFEALFFNEKIRESVRKENTEVFKKSWRNATDSYFKRCYNEEKKISIADLDRILWECLEKNPIPEKCPRNVFETNYIRDIIFECWKILRSKSVYGEKTSFQTKEKFIFGMLYIMRNCDSEHLAWLKKWLPCSTELRKYTNTNHKITNYVRDLKKIFREHKAEIEEKGESSKVESYFQENYKRPFVLDWLLK